MKGVSFVNRRYTEGEPFCEKWYLKGWRVWPPGRASPYKHLLSTPSPQGGQHLPFSAISSHPEEKIHNLIVVTLWSSWWVEKNDLLMVTESFWNLSNTHICKVHRLIDISFKDKIKFKFLPSEVKLEPNLVVNLLTSLSSSAVVSLAMVGAFKGWSTVSIKDILCSSKKHPYLPPLLPHGGHFYLRPSPRWNFHFTGCLSYPPSTPWNFCNFPTLLGTPWKNISVKNALALYFYAKACHCFHTKERKNLNIYVNAVSNNLE